ncbi:MULTISPECIES: preprotein translocase subunit SecE [Burkholderia]|uniref:preprotein translocase subunit SecE n=1 Tax=Burkholderia TaxID=32008 RepID=UPI0007591B67|nr:MULTISPECIES: preprotein translocase subunit SecE [Burkholderia]AOK08975.1 preprotein translocase subunit SecE [Burkholderia vietnamiensis]KVE18183.1 preprotein translocase subunit SecE [Burkholderia vietnamiensis]KVS25075.1 preprotein translocase subunit SecE [Burkholderia vietnamiensis]MBR8015827.1 preprotein translocase subunit SecE [Burkholderia vietnamiensis]MDN7669206.1 preprotein translocase subunit SecE [Burkholderia vietnamiensis]
MANPSVETVNTSGDKLMLALGVLLVLAGFVGFFWLGNQQWYVRGAALAVGIIAGVAVGLMSAPGKSLIAFAKDSYKEVRKVVWPTRKEATQTTLVVFGFVLVMAIFLWLSDKSIEWVIFSAILGWK